MTVHPHACGEHPENHQSARHSAGSSPRLWGTQSPLAAAAPVVRFIPTPVGNTLLIGSALRSPPVHPHACGEHRLDDNLTNPRSGSSPRLWGTPAHGPRHRLPYRFIPTPVGNTFIVLPYICSSSVHPHACGEHVQRNNQQFKQFGSSPRLWGTPRQVLAN